MIIRALITQNITNVGIKHQSTYTDSYSQDPELSHTSHPAAPPSCHTSFVMHLRAGTPWTAASPGLGRDASDPIKTPHHVFASPSEHSLAESRVLSNLPPNATLNI